MFEKITRKQAKAEGRNKYFTGKPCSFGHITQRYVNSSACVACGAYYGKGERPIANPNFRLPETFSVTVTDPLNKELVHEFVKALNASTACSDAAAGRFYGKDGLLIPPPPFRNPA